MKRHLKGQNGLTFVEVMVTLVVLSLGILAIFKVFIVSLDRMAYISNRLYADILLDNRIVLTKRMLKAYQVLPFDMPPREKINTGSKILEFEQHMGIVEVPDLSEVFQMYVTISWFEHDRKVEIRREAYLSEFGNID